MNINCVELFGLNQTYEFFGDAINYRNVQNYSAKARFDGSIDNTSIYPVWTGVAGLLAQVTGVIPIYTQGVFLGSGKITSFSAQDGADVTDKPFSINFEILKSGDLSNFTGAGLTGTYSYLPYLNSLEESIQYTQNNLATTDYTRNISFGIEKGYFNQISGAKIVSSSLLSGLVQLGVYSPLQPPHYSGASGMFTSRSQSIDTINGNFSYSEAYSYQPGIQWVHEYQHSLQYDNGISTVSEQGTIQANRRGTRRIDYAISGWNVVNTGIYSRVTGVFGRWNMEFQSTSGCFLDSIPSDKSFTEDFAKGNISYNYSYNNDPSSNGSYYNSYQQTISENQNGWLETQINGSLRYKNPKTTGALAALNLIYTGAIRPQIQNYVQDFGNNSLFFFGTTGCYYAGVSTLSNSNETYIDIPTEIDYDFSYTNDPTYISTGSFRKIKNTLSNQEVTALTNIFRIVNYLELPQNSFQSNMGILSNKIEIIGSSGVSIDSYKSTATGRLVTPTGNYWMTANSYNFNPFGYEFSMDVQYAYEGYRAINDFNI